VDENAPTMREPDQIRQDTARKLRAVQVSDLFLAILGCLLGEDWTTPRLLEMMVTSGFLNSTRTAQWLIPTIRMTS